MSATIDYQTLSLDEMRDQATFDVDDMFDVVVGGACYSQPEAKAKALATVKTCVDDLASRRQGWVHYWRASVNDPAIAALLQEAVNEAAESDKTTTCRVRELLNLLATKTSWNGQDPVFLKRATLADELGISVATVGRCLAAAERAGFLSLGVQMKWLELDADGEWVWCASSSVRMLTLPTNIRHLRSAENRRKKQTQRCRADQRTAEAERIAKLKQKREDAVQARKIDEQVAAAGNTVPFKRTPQDNTTGVSYAARIKQRLASAPSWEDKLE